MPPLHAPLDNYIGTVLPLIDHLTPGRKSLLDELKDYVSQSAASGRCELIFICTHNSRRSHISQIWAQVAAFYYGIDSVITYSGGTEATAFHPNAVAAMKRAGLTIEPTTDGSNPVYEVGFATSQPSMRIYSKVYDDDANPTKGFGAVMTCSHADENCPVVFGASKRISLHYEDPKIADGTPEESEVYDSRVLQIASEMFYAMSGVNS